MEEDKIEEILGRIESELAKGNRNAPKDLGFWKIVSVAKRDPQISAGFGERLGRIDKLIFESKNSLKLSYRLGTALEIIAALVGLVFLILGTSSQGLESALYLVASALMLMTALHPLAHSLVAWFLGIGFHFYYLNGPMKIEPTLKIDYATYIKTPPEKRALFHLAGSLNSTLVTLIVLIMAIGSATPSSAKLILALIWLFTTASEILPLLLIKMGMPKILFADFRKTDTYRAVREWKMR